MTGDDGLEIISSTFDFSSLSEFPFWTSEFPNFAEIDAVRLACDPAIWAVSWFKFNPGIPFGNRGKPVWPSWAKIWGGNIGIGFWDRTKLEIGLPVGGPPGIEPAADPVGNIGKRGIEPYRAAWGFNAAAAAAWGLIPFDNP